MILQRQHIQEYGYRYGIVQFNYSEDCRKKAWQLGQVKLFSEHGRSLAQCFQMGL